MQSRLVNWTSLLMRPQFMFSQSCLENLGMTPKLANLKRFLCSLQALNRIFLTDTSRRLMLLGLRLDMPKHILPCSITTLNRRLNGRQRSINPKLFVCHWSLSSPSLKCNYYLMETKTLRNQQPPKPLPSSSVPSTADDTQQIIEGQLISYANHMVFCLKSVKL